ncbi:MAG: ATP synthase F1 subunit gamma [Bacteroidales bacterium]|nr:ATP synthase F1 subunit gamma [Bacteroidales bacterium]
MPNLKDIRIRINSVISTRQITSAMKMVSAAKLRKTQDAIIKMRPYVNRLQQIMGEVTKSIQDDIEISYIKSRPVNKVLFVLVTSNKGLCGAFNSNLVRQINHYIHEQYEELNAKGNVHLYCIGKKGYDMLKNKNITLYKHDTHFVENVTYEKSVILAESLMQLYDEQQYDKIIFFYNRFKNAAVQIITPEVFLPVIPSQENKIKSDDKFLKNYIFEPNHTEILTEILPLSLKSQVYKILLDSVTAENGARMTAMHKATENATEMLYELRLNYNKARQAAITKEILEIVSGANALKG